MAHKMISCFKGLAPVSIPEEWLVGFDFDTSFAYVGDEARIRFPNGRAFGVRVTHSGPTVHQHVRRLSDDESAQTSWGAFCAPWESYQTAHVFGHGPVTKLDTV